MNYLAAATSLLAALAVTPLLLHHFGEAAFGVWALATTLVGYLQILELGFGSACTKLMAEDAGKRPLEVSRTLSTSLVALSGAGLVALVLGLILAFGAPYWFNVPEGLEGVTTAVVASLSVALAISIPGDVFGGGLAAYQRFDLRSISNLAMALVTTGATFVLVLSGGGLVAVALATAIISLFFHPVRWAMLRKVDPELRLSPRLITRRRLSVVSRMSGWFLVGDIAALVSYSADLVILGAVLGVKDVALYVIGWKLSVLAQRALDEASTVLLPEASALAKDGSSGAMAELLVDGTRVTMLVGLPISLVMGLLARPAVRAWVGHGYDTAATVLVVFSLYSALRTVVNPMESVIIGTGKLRSWASTMSVQAVLNTAVTLVLVGAIGVTGPALGTLAGTLVVLTPAYTVIACRAAQLPVAAFARRVVVPHLLPSAATSLVLIPARRLAEDGRLQLAAVAIGATLVYGVVYYLAGATASERSHLRRLVSRVWPG